MMSIIQKQLKVKTKTSGFSSPAETYVSDRLDLNELIVNDTLTTFYFRYKGENDFGVSKNSILVIDKSETPKQNDFVVVIDNDKFKLVKYDNHKNLWGRVSWIIEKV